MISPLLAGKPEEQLSLTLSPVPRLDPAPRQRHVRPCHVVVHDPDHRAGFARRGCEMVAVR
jgi:hypothetical protein